MKAETKTIKKWEKSNLEWHEYFKKGDRIDEETFIHMIEELPAEYTDENFGQQCEAGFTRRIEGVKIYFHATAISTNDGKYYYLGDLPSLNQLNP